MTGYESKSEDNSTMDYHDLNSVDEGEAIGILASLGKRYYKAEGMGNSLDIDKLRFLHGKNFFPRCMSNEQGWALFKDHHSKIIGHGR